MTLASEYEPGQGNKMEIEQVIEKPADVSDRLASAAACALAALGLWLVFAVATLLWLAMRHSFEVSWDSVWGTRGDASRNLDFYAILFRVAIWGFLVVPGIAALVGFVAGSDAVFKYWKDQSAEYREANENARPRQLQLIVALLLVIAVGAWFEMG